MTIRIICSSWSTLTHCSHSIVYVVKRHHLPPSLIAERVLINQCSVELENYKSQNLLYFILLIE